MGVNITIERVKKFKNIKKLPVLQFCLYGFFLNAEVAAIVTDEYRDDIVKKILSGKIDQNRRLKAVNKQKWGELDFIDMPWVATIEGNLRRIRIAYYDTCGIHGPANYAGLCEATGIELIYKDTLSQKDKEDMLSVYVKKPTDFDNYALGDLYNYDALKNNAKNFKQIYEILGISDYYVPPKLTIGSTIKDIFRGIIGKTFDIQGKKEIDKLVDLVCKSANANHLKTQIETTRCLNAKVRGGRCYNNKPLLAAIAGVLCDIDISGCYGEGQRNQLYPFGIPMIYDYRWDEQNKLMTLRKFLKKHGDELVPGLWQAVVSTKQPLKYRQDFLQSWILPPKLEDIKNMKVDSDIQGSDLEELDNWLNKGCGEIKLFNHEIINGLITHDFLEWLDNVCSPQQKTELLDNLLISTVIFYPLSERVDSADELLEKLRKFEGKNECKGSIKKGDSEVINTHKKCHSWYAVNMGDMLITKLLVERKKYPKKSPLNTLLKLCINTLYGDMVSPYFKESNVIVGNNITARARALAWYMEKGLGGFQSITDGCVFDLNKVPFNGRRKLSGENTVNTHRYYDRNLEYKPLEGESITMESWDLVEVEKDKFELRPTLKIDEIIIPALKSYNWIDKTAMIHLQNCFPNVSVLHSDTTDVYGKPRKGQFVFETKAVYESGSFHGTANYCLVNPNGIEVKMRSYEKTKQQLYDGDNLIDSQTTPAKTFLTQLLKNPHAITRSIPFVKPAIVKPKDFRSRYKSFFKDTNLVPGDTFYKSGLLRELSLSQFTFLSYSQYKNWTREYLRLKNKYFQSYEMFFIQDGILNYQAMIENIDKAIGEGETSFLAVVDKNRNKSRNGDLSHINGDIYEGLKGKINDFYFDNKEEIEDSWGNMSGDKDFNIEYEQTSELLTDDSLLDDIDF
jgi:hypothetical protein